MGSILMHLAIATKVNKKLKLNEKDFYLGSIAPDISSYIEQSKMISHFIEKVDGNPNLNNFLKKYANDLDSPFTLGYFLHLYADYIWVDHYMHSVYHNGNLKLLNGKVFFCTNKECQKILYNDYNSLSDALINHYNLNLSIFFNEPGLPKTKIEEIPLGKLQTVIDHEGIYLLEEKKEYQLIDEATCFSYVDEVSKGFLTWYLNKKKKS